MKFIPTLITAWNQELSSS